MLVKCAVELERTTIGRVGESRYTQIIVNFGEHEYPDEKEERLRLEKEQEQRLLEDGNPKIN